MGILSENQMKPTAAFNAMTMRVPQLPTGRSRDPWARENLSDTLGALGAGFLSGNGFFEGVGNATQNFMGQRAALRQADRKNVTYGGPGGQFEITTDRDGNHSYRRVPEFQQAAEEILKDRHDKPDPKFAADQQARVIHAISRLPANEQSAAWAQVLANPKAFNIDASNLPAEWSPTFGAVAGSAGLSVNQAETLAQRGAMEAKRIEKIDADIANNNARTSSTVAKNNSAIAKAAASSGQAKVKALTTGQIVNGFKYKGGDPKNPQSWEKA